VKSQQQVSGKVKLPVSGELAISGSGDNSAAILIVDI